jgi:hypothetical protein
MWMIIAAVAVIGGVFCVDQYWSVLPSSVAYSTNKISVSSENTQNPILADSDWQKVLVGAGISNLGNNGSLGSGTTSMNSAPLTTTAKLGEVLVSDYLQLQQSGGDESTDTIDSMVSNVLSNPNIVPQAKVYAFSDIKIGKDDSINADLIYGQILGALFKNNDAVGNEATYARDSAEQNDPSILKKIDPIIASYKNILNGLIAMTVPPSIASMHLDLINAMSERLSVAELLRMTDTDPAASLEGAGQYLNALQDLSNAFGAIKQYFATLKADLNTGTTSSTAIEQMLQ